MELYIPVWVLWTVAGYFVGATANVLLWLVFSKEARREFKSFEGWSHIVFELILLWPLALFALPTIKIRRWKRERKRQQRITEDVREGKITVEFARNNLKWKG